MKLLTLLTLAAGLAAAQTQTYSFDPGVSCIAAATSQGYQILNCDPATSLQNADGTTLSFHITECYLGGFKACTITTTVSGMPSITNPVVVTRGLASVIMSADAIGQFTFVIQGRCWGGGHGNPEHCQLVSIGSPSGTLTVTQ